MNSNAQLKTLLSFVRALQTAGCIVSQTGRVELPFRATRSSLSSSAADVRAKALTKLARTIKRSGLVVSTGELGVTKSVTLKHATTETLICKLAQVAGGGFQLRPTKNWAKPAPVKAKAKAKKAKAVKAPKAAKKVPAKAGKVPKVKASKSNSIVKAKLVSKIKMPARKKLLERQAGRAH